MSQSSSRFRILFLALFFIAGLTPAFADDKDSKTEAKTAVSVAKVITDMAQKKNSTDTILQQAFKTSLTELKDTVVRTNVDIQGTEMKLHGESPSFLNALVYGLSGEEAVSNYKTSTVKVQTNATNSVIFSGYKEVVDPGNTGSGLGSTMNPFGGTLQANQGLIKRILVANFCIPTARNATPECKAKTTTTASSYEDFIGFILFPSTWQQGSGIAEVFTMARQFFAGAAANKAFMNQGLTDAPEYIATQGFVAQANLKMAVINDLASWRAPTSTIAGTAGDLYLQLLAPTNMITSSNYSLVCSKAANIEKNPVLSQACSLTTPAPVLANGKPARLISKAAIDKIMHYDYMLSPLFYNQISSSTYTAIGPIQKVGVYLKAQRLAQSYRALRLQQEKVALKAMNLMNRTAH